MVGGIVCKITWIGNRSIVDSVTASVIVAVEVADPVGALSLTLIVKGLRITEVMGQTVIGMEGEGSSC